MKIINGQEVTAKLSAALRDIARLTGFSEKDVIKSEAGAILKTWAGRTKVAKPAQIELRARRRVLHDMGLTKTSTVGGITINVGTRALAGRVWVRTNGNRGTGRPYKLAGQQSFSGDAFVPMNNHWKNGTWTDIQEAWQDSGSAMKRAMPMAQASAGLARQSVIQIGDDLGIKLESLPGGGISAAGIAKARAAMASDGKRYINGLAQQKEEKEAGRYFVTLIQRLPYWPKMGMDRILAGVLGGRVGLYRRTFADGAYKSIEASARNYPWMKTRLQGLAA
jgi:hypothetical protein